MTSPEGRLRCGRPSAFVPASLQSFLLRSIPTSVPLRFSLSDSRQGSFFPRRRRSQGLFAYPPIHFSASLSFRSTLPSALQSYILPVFVHMSHRPLSHRAIFLPFYISRTHFSPLLLPSVIRVRLPIFDSFHPETRQALLCIGNSFTDVWSNMF